MPPKKITQPTVVITDHEGKNYSLKFTTPDETSVMRPLFYGNSPIRGIVTNETINGNPIIIVNVNLQKYMIPSNIAIINKLTRFAAGKYAKPPLTLDLGIDNAEISRLTAESGKLKIGLDRAASGRDYVSSEWLAKIKFTETMFSFYTDAYGNNLRLFEFLDENFKEIMDLDPTHPTDITLKGISYGAIYASEKRVKYAGMDYSASSIGGAHFGAILEASDAPPPSPMATASSTPHRTILDDVCKQIISKSKDPANKRLKKFFGYNKDENDETVLKQKILYKMKAVDYDFTLVKGWGANLGEIYGVFDVNNPTDQQELSKITSLVMETLVKATLYLNQNRKHILIPDEMITLTLYTLARVPVPFTVTIDKNSIVFKSRSSYLRPQPTPGTSLVSLDAIYKLLVNGITLDYQSNMVDVLLAKSSISVVKTPNAGYHYDTGIINTEIPEDDTHTSLVEAANYTDYLSRLLKIRGGTGLKVDTTQIRVDLMALLMSSGAGPNFKQLLEHHKVQVNAGFMEFLLSRPDDKISELLDEVRSRVTTLSEPGDKTKTKVSIYVSPNVSIDAITTPDKPDWNMRKFSIPPKECVSIRMINNANKKSRHAEKPKDNEEVKAAEKPKDNEEVKAAEKPKAASDSDYYSDYYSDSDSDSDSDYDYGYDPYAGHDDGISEFGWKEEHPDFYNDMYGMVEFIQQESFFPPSPPSPLFNGSPSEFMRIPKSPPRPDSTFGSPRPDSMFGSPRPDSTFGSPYQDFTVGSPHPDFTVGSPHPDSMFGDSEWKADPQPNERKGGKSTRKTRHKITKRNPRKPKRNKTRKRKPLNNTRTKPKR